MRVTGTQQMGAEADKRNVMYGAPPPNPPPCPFCEGWLIIYWELAGKGRFSEELSYAKEDLPDTGGLAYCEVMIV